MKNYFLIVSLIIMTACAPKNLADKISPFRLISPGLSNLEQGSIPIQINRADLSSGPSFQVLPENSSEIIKTSIKVICKDLEYKYEVLDFNFKMSDRNFTGLNQLPTNANCIMSIGLTNKNGSFFSKDYPIRFDFNAHQNFNIYRTVSANGRFSPVVTGNGILLERFIIRNDFKYPLGFTYSARNFACIGVNMSLPSNPKGAIYTTQAKQVVLSGSFTNLVVGTPSFVHFLIQPGETVQVDLLGFADFVRTDSKLQNLKCSAPLDILNLTTWRDLKYTHEDEKNPLRIQLSAEKIGSF